MTVQRAKTERSERMKLSWTVFFAQMTVQFNLRRSTFERAVSHEFLYDFKTLKIMHLNLSTPFELNMTKILHILIRYNLQSHHVI